MPNIIQNPGFEVDDASWLFEDNASRLNVMDAHGGSWVGRLDGGRDPFLGTWQSRITQTLSTVDGETRVLTFWHRADRLNPVPLWVYVDSGDGVPVPLDFPVETLTWTQYVSVPIAFTGPGVLYFFVGPPIIPAVDNAGVWQVDDVAVILESEVGAGEVLNRGRRTAYQAMLTMLRGINGTAGGYWNDLSARVFEGWQTPDELGDRIWTPYVCCPLDDITDTPEHAQVHIVRRDWVFRVYGYVPENASDPQSSSAADDVLKLEEDIFRAQMADRTMAAQVRESSIARVNVNAGLGMGYAPLVVEIRFLEWFTRDQLGSLA